MDFFSFIKGIFGSTDWGNNQQNINMSETKYDEYVPNPYKPFIRVTDRIKTAFSSKYGLYPHEILMLHYAPTTLVGQKKFYGFWLYDYGVEYPSKLIESLIDRGFLQQGSIADTIANLKLSELKSLLKQNGLPITGNKPELLKRVMNRLPLDQLASKYTHRYYALTDLGKAALTDGEYVPYFHTSKVVPYTGFDIWFLNQLLHENPGISYHQCIIQYLEKMAGDYKKQRHFGLYRCYLLSLHDVYVTMNNWYAALDKLTEVFFWDLSGMEEDQDYKELNRSNYKSSQKSILSIYQWYNNALIGYIRKLQKHLGMTDNQLREYLTSKFTSLRSEFHLLLPSECVDFVFACISKDDNAIRNINDSAMRRLK